MATLGLAIGQDAFSDIKSLFQTSLNGMQKEDATTIVNGLEPLFNENVQNFLKNPTPGMQQEAISNFNYMWLTMVQQLESFAKGGTAAVNDRSPGGKVDWWRLYYNPIENYKFPPAAAQSAAQPQDAGAGAAPIGGIAAVNTPAASSAATVTPVAVPSVTVESAPSLSSNPTAILVLLLLVGVLAFAARKHGISV